ncbi:MAG: M14 family zinc carboxypeptidase [Thiohalospira sp.]
MKNIFLCSMVTLGVFFNSCTFNRLETPLEESNFKLLSTNQQILEFLDRAGDITPNIDYQILDTTFNGKYIPIVKISNHSNEEKPSILFIGQQHGNEPSGKEGLLLLIKDFANGKFAQWIDKADLYIIPQANPDGADLNHRRTSNQIDLNRDHLILKSIEAKAIQNIFHELKPVVTVDFHEYYPYSSSWKDFGYYRDFDIQFGGLTNINIDSKVKNYFYEVFFPKVKEDVEQSGYSFFEYTLGNFALGERLRHSTVDINDGRQSFGICNTLSFIVEGKNGRDSIFEIERRAKSQYLTAKSILKTSVLNIGEIDHIVKEARNKTKKSNQGEKASIRMDHFQGNDTLRYPLKSVKTRKDTIFMAQEFHNDVKSRLDIDIPKAYLIPVSDTILVEWLKRSNFTFYKYDTNKKDQIFRYKILNLHRSVDEELENYYPEVAYEKINHEFLKEEYFAVPTHQFYKYKIVTALEPQAMYGIANYPYFEYLLFDDYFKIYRVEY